MESVASTSSRDYRDALLSARVRFLFDGMPLAMTATLLLAGVTTLILASAEHSSLLYGWYAAIVAITALRTGQYLRYRRTYRSGAAMDWRLWRRRFLLGCAMIGALWGCASLFLFPRDLAYQVFLSFVVAGTSAGAVTTLSSDRTAALAFVVPSITPLALMLMLQGTTFGLAMGLMVVLYLVLVVAATHRSHVQLVQAVQFDLEASASREALVRSERERRVSAERLRALFEFSPLGMALLDDNHQVLDANPALMKLLGFTAADLKNPSAHPALRALSKLPVGDDPLTSTGSLGAAEYELPGRAGAAMAVSLHGMRVIPEQGDVYRWAFIEDITDRKAAADRLRKLSERLMMASEAARIGVWEFDPAMNDFFWDRRMHELLDCDPNSTASRLEQWRQRLHPNDLDRAIANRASVQHEGARFEHEYRIVRGDGEERVLMCAGRSAVDPHTGQLRVTGLAWDATELKRAERLKSEFLSTVSHELRTPLTSLRASIGLVANGAVGQLEPPVQQLLALADRNAERLGRLIDDLLDIERIESSNLRMEMAPHELLPIVRQAIQAQSAHARLCGVDLLLHAESDELQVRADAGRLLQVLVNLLSNAAKFSRPNACVSVKVLRCANHARVEVHDCGPGIDLSLRGRLFTKFSQGDSSDSRGRGGTGLGLAIAKSLIEQMGGTIGYESTNGLGSTFFFELPLLLEHKV